MILALLSMKLIFIDLAKKKKFFRICPLNGFSYSFHFHVRYFFRIISFQYEFIFRHLIKLTRNSHWLP